MKKLFIFIILMGGGFAYFGGTFPAPDGNTRMAGPSLPNLAFLKDSPLVSLALSLISGHGPWQDAPPTQAAASPAATLGYPQPYPQSVAGQPAPGLPAVHSPNGTVTTPSLIAPTAVSQGRSGPLVIPPELVKFISPSLLTSNPAGTQNLNPASQQALQQIIAQARANPAAFKDQLAAVAKAIQGQ